MRSRSLSMVIVTAWSCSVVAACVPSSTSKPPTTEDVAPPAPPTPPPSVIPDPATEAQAVADAEQELVARRIGLYTPRHKAGRQVYPSQGYMVPVAPISDGFIYSGQLDEDGASRLVIGKFDLDWKSVWQIVYEKKGFKAYEGGLVAEDPEGNILAVVPSYVNPASFPDQRFVKLSSAGAIIWELQLPRDRWGNKPQIHFGKVAADGSLELAGHVYTEAPRKEDRPAHRWAATITTDGKLTGETIGDPIDWATDDW